MLLFPASVFQSGPVADGHLEKGQYSTCQPSLRYPCWWNRRIALKWFWGERLSVLICPWSVVFDSLEK